MIKATTPTHIFTFPEEVVPATCAKIQITYSQENDRACRVREQVILEKNKADVTIDGQSVSIELTQEEMNRFKPGVAQIQVRAKDSSDKVMASQIFNVKVKKVLNEEVL